MPPSTSPASQSRQTNGTLVRRQTSPLSPGDSSLAGVIARFEALHRESSTPIAAIRTQPAREARFAEIPARTDPRIRAALASKGIEQLYVHQAQSLEQISAGKNVAVVTPTASGKTLCYNLPVLNALAADSAACALYLFPTQALAVDQLEEYPNNRDGRRYGQRKKNTQLQRSGRKQASQGYACHFCHITQQESFDKHQRIQPLLGSGWRYHHLLGQNVQYGNGKRQRLRKFRDDRIQK